MQKNPIIKHPNFGQLSPKLQELIQEEYADHVNSMESYGDVRNVISIMDDGAETIQLLNHIHNTLMEACVKPAEKDFESAPWDYYRLLKFKAFSQTYPKIYRTMEVWAWS